MNKTMEYMAYELPVVAFDLVETRVSAQDAAVYVRPNDVVAYGDAIVELVDDPDRRSWLGKIGRERVEDVLAWEPPGGPLRQRVRAAARPNERSEPMCGIAGLYELAARPASTPRRCRRAIAHRGPDGDGLYTGTAARAGGRPRAAGPPPAGHHRPVDRGRPAVREGRPGLRLQRRALQLPRAAGRARGPRRAVPHPVRHRGRAGGLAPVGSGQPAPAAGHVRLRDLRRGHAAGWCSPATTSASSRCSTPPTATAWRSAPSSRACSPALGQVDLDLDGIVASLMYYWVPESHCVVQGRREAAARSLGRGLARTAAAACTSTGRPRPTSSSDLAAAVARRAARGDRRTRSRATSWPTCP